MPTIAAIIITKNEQQCIQECIESIIWVDEIIVLDSGSTDHTTDICKKYAPRLKLYETDWPGFGAQKNRALDLATTDWVLSIDADEKVTAELKDEILQALNNKDCIAYQIPRLTYFYKHPIKYCFNNKQDAPVRLAKKDCCRFSDDLIHEKLMVNGKTKKLKNNLHHYSYRNLEETINKINNYSTLGAIQLYQTQRKTNPLLALAHASWIFIKIYFLRLGFLDGWPGFIVALSNFEGTFYKYAKLLEKETPQKND